VGKREEKEKVPQTKPKRGVRKGQARLMSCVRLQRRKEDAQGKKRTGQGRGKGILSARWPERGAAMQNSIRANRPLEDGNGREKGQEEMYEKHFGGKEANQ